MARMKSLLERLSPILRLTRVTTAFAVVANAWFVVLWSRGHTEETANADVASGSLWLQLAGATANALGLFGFGMCVNDILDLRRDRLLRPDRPLASGAASLETAVALVAWSLMLAVLGALVSGPAGVLLTLSLAGAILIFNGAARFVPAFGLVAYGLIYAGQMLVPNPRLDFLWPVWLVFSLAVFLTGAGHQLARKIPAISSRAWAAAVIGWVCWTVILSAVAISRNRGHGGLWPEWVRPTAVLWPLAVILALLLLCWRKLRTVGRTPRAAEKISRYGTLAMSFLGCAWMFGDGRAAEGSALAGLAVAGYLGMTVLRELYGLIEHPVGYRR